ncbi:hypothetical protein L1049_023587 [Liquidambar formosana]|uniref:Ubiquitin-like domain-containing protein n=1 Tax=Liquidambar formosana TaxID=63359 RepID=A0AAP0RTA9_LIQFO
MDEVTIVVEGAEVKPTITISTSATILQLKGKIEGYTGVCVSRQTLWLRTLELKDSNFIDYYGLTDIVPIRLVTQPLPTELKLDITVSAAALGYQLKFQVKETDTVYQLKQKIEETWGVSPEDISLWHLAVEMKDDHHLSNYYIHEGSQVNLRTPMLC